MLNFSFFFVKNHKFRVGVGEVIVSTWLKKCHKNVRKCVSKALWIVQLPSERFEHIRKHIVEQTFFYSHGFGIQKHPFSSDHISIAVNRLLWWGLSLFIFLTHFAPHWANNYRQLSGNKAMQLSNWEKTLMFRKIKMQTFVLFTFKCFFMQKFFYTFCANTSHVYSCFSFVPSLIFLIYHSFVLWKRIF